VGSVQGLFSCFFSPFAFFFCFPPASHVGGLVTHNLFSLPGLKTNLDASGVCVSARTPPLEGSGSGGHGWRALGCAQCLSARDGGAAASRPALQGFRRARRPRVGVRGGRSGVSGRVLAGCGWWSSGCALLLRGFSPCTLLPPCNDALGRGAVRCRIWAGVARSLSLALSNERWKPPWLACAWARCTRTWVLAVNRRSLFVSSDRSQGTPVVLMNQTKL
jgi:hypothetical protein